jgi:hypothetical protein
LSRWQIADGIQQITYGKQQAADRRQQTADIRQQTPDVILPRNSPGHASSGSARAGDPRSRPSREGISKCEKRMLAGEKKGVSSFTRTEITQALGNNRGTSRGQRNAGAGALV